MKFLQSVVPVTCSEGILGAVFGGALGGFF